jgi:hypothetical protein
VIFPYGETVAVLRALLVDADYNNEDYDWPNATSTPYAGCAVAQGGRDRTTEIHTGDRDVIISDLIIFMPPGTDVTATDRLNVRGRAYEVVGEPFGWTSPFSGTRFGVVVYCKRVEG